MRVVRVLPTTGRLRTAPACQYGGMLGPARLRPTARRLLRSALVGAVALGLLLWWLLPDKTPEPAGRLEMTTGVPSGVYARYGELLKQRMARDLPEVRVALRSSQGSVHNLERVATGGSSLTIAQADTVADYLDGNGRGADRLRACARLYDDYVQLVVPEGSAVRGARQLRGLRVGVGEPRSGVTVIAGRLLRAAGLDIDRDVTAVRQGIDRMPELLRAGELDAFFWSGGLPTSAIERLAEKTPIRLVPLGDLVPALRAQDPVARYYRAAVMPPDSYPSVAGDQAVRTVAVANLLVTTDRVDPALIEGVTRSVIRGRDRIGREVHAAQLVDLRSAIYTDPLELHEGARRYYRAAKT